MELQDTLPVDLPPDILPMYLQYQQFQPKEKQTVTERQSVPKNPVRQPKFRKSRT